MFGGRLFDIGYAVTECQDGGYAITGHTFDGSDRSSNLLLTRLNSEGEFLWRKSYGTSNDDEGRSILQAENGDFLVVGFTNGYIDSSLNTHSTPFAMRVSDSEQWILPPREYGPPDIGLISAGGALAILTLFGAYLMLRRSRREIRQSWVEPKRRILKKSFLSPRLLDELSAVLRGKISCAKCNELNPRSNLRCVQCTSHLHFCLFCGQVIRSDDQVLFCPKCKAIAHSNHMLEWLAKRNYCPLCHRRFKRPKHLETKSL
jgi:hypothetical protein